jgi:alpha-galactosidase
MFRYRYQAFFLSCVFVLVAARSAPCESSTTPQVITSPDGLSVAVQRDGTYAISNERAHPEIIEALAAAEIDHKWIKCTDYPRHEITQSDFDNPLGRGKQIKVVSSGLTNVPDLTYSIQIYEGKSFGVIDVELQNHAADSVTVQSIRSVEAIGKKIIDLGADQRSDRILSDSFSEDWPPLQIYNLGKTPKGMHRAIGSQLIYNRESHQSLFWGALTSDRLLTILHLQTAAAPSKESAITAFTIDSTGTTEIQATDEESGLREGAAENIIELNLPLPAGDTMKAERLMFSAGNDYHSQLENYGAVIRELHHSRIASDNMLGWWSWTAFYFKITGAAAFTNAQWLAQHLKNLGYDYFHFDLGYGYARSEYATPNASQFPQGMLDVTRRVTRLGLKVGVWTAPFEVSELAWIYEHHKDWLVHNAHGEPICIGKAEEVEGERLFVLDVTNPSAQEYLRQTYRTLVREWGATYIKLDFMDNTAIEGYYFRPNTTALEAQRIGLEIIRKTVGEDVRLDKDGSPMLNPVGLVDEGRVSQDTGHAFLRSKEAAPGIAARYYMHRNFFIEDADAFTISRQLIEERTIQAPLTLEEAQVSIALAAVSGGMFEIGDDLPTLGKDPDRVALVENPDLLAMAKIGQAAIPLDLLTYADSEEQPSIFLLRQDQRQSMLAVFNWTAEPQSRSLSLSDLKLAPGAAYKVVDIFPAQQTPAIDHDAIRINNQAPHSVRMIKILNTAIPSHAPAITFDVPARGKIAEEIKFSSRAGSDGVPTFNQRWDFGDGTNAEGSSLTHAYTTAGNYAVKFTADGLDGMPAEKTFSVTIAGSETLAPPRRYSESQP